ncbi:hypothetical protein PMZ80_005751 [Knufia obscura]|uniref:Chitin-binding type-4 domain-containing protein n=2 Tax=Knufia TaxID=430999 RepID=A0AAN8EMN8_9EURO|nr:hypothetical protein PMZ80_005751 [Knufia obscura]KAK5954417.1 hypothetical protein OHC33_004139 [Knufia fluminis]
MPSINIQSLLTLTPFLIASAHAHGYITTPTARQPGPQFGSLCGAQTLSNQGSDIYGNIQGELQVAGTGLTAECNLWLCKGFVFEDQDASSVQSYTAGETVPIHFDIRAPHDGAANISIVDTGSNSVLSTLKSWDEYALTSRPISKEETDFEVVIPSDLGGKCTSPGECVIQMFWDARSIDQTYESCVDFVVGGGSGGAAPSGSAGVSSAVPSETSTSASFAISTSGVASGINVVTSTTSATGGSVTSAPEMSILPVDDVFTLTAGTQTMKCREEL